MFSHRLAYSHEYERKLRVGLAGCGGQAFRNILPSFQYAPVDLVAVCDIDSARAAAYARTFGALRSYGDYQEMLAREELDAIFLATGYDANAHPRYPQQAAVAMRAGFHVWIEKPPASSVKDIEEVRAVQEETGRQVGVGFMKMFTPSAAKVKKIIARSDFGAPTSMYLRDPEKLPLQSDRGNPQKMIYLLDHIVHPASLIHHLMGQIRRIYVEEGPAGEAVITMKFTSGACGVLHLPWGQSGMSPMERLEIVGQGANVVVDNNVRLTYYRPGHRGLGSNEYGRIGDYTGADDDAPLHWEMDGYSGQPYNMHLFYQGYAPEILYFCERLLKDEPIAIAGLGDAWHVMRFYETLRTITSAPIELASAPAWTLRGDSEERSGVAPE